MKGNISRDSHRPEARYSGVFQVQGGMVTDADLGEQAKIACRRSDGLGHDTAGCGVPVEDGAVVIKEGIPHLTEGVVYAEGVRGETRATGELPKPMSLYGKQLDFPLAPELPVAGDHIVYADLWRRMVSNLEDPILSDPGLHGAETAFRARTMAQIKVAPLAQADNIGNANGPIPRIGGGVLTVTPVDPDAIVDECDPCADTVSADQTVANALFRIEVLHVFGDPQSPDRIVVGWSAENASAMAPASVNSEDFSRAGAVYEFFSYSTETHLGVHENNAAVARSSFATSLAAGPAVAAAPEGGDWPFVRRWNGAVEIDFTAGTATRVGGGGGVEVSGRKIGLTTDAFTSVIDFSNRPTVAGDYWLIEMRRFADTPIRMVQDTPIGVLHNYCPLFRISNGDIVPLSDDATRRLSFPTLANLPATHVGFDNNCPKLYDDAENVQEALDKLCAIDASDITFDPSDCKRLYDDTDNVQDALINLCKVDFGNERLLRLLHDWGVICGVIPSLAEEFSDRVRITSGAILDKAGRIGSVKDMEIALNELVGTEFFHFDSFDSFFTALRKNQVCLALAINQGGEIRPHLATKKRAFGPVDPTFLSVFNECREKNPPFDPKDDFTIRPDKERLALEKVVYGAGNEKLAASQRLNREEQIFAREYNDSVVERYKAHVNDDAEAEMLDRRIIEIDQKFGTTGTAGEVLEARLMQREAAVYAAVKQQDAERLRRCLCDALLPRCPEIGEAPHLVPIACIQGTADNNEIFLRKICVHGCRKQAMSWRMVQYFISELRDRLALAVETVCCPPDEDTPPGIAPPFGSIALGTLDEKLKPETVSLQAEKSLAILTGRNPPNDYRITPDVSGLGVDKAKAALAGNGVEVVEAIDANDAEAIKKIRNVSVGIKAEDLVLDEGYVAPGDKVALVVQDGVSIGYVKVETGGGKFIFERAKPEMPGIIDQTKSVLEEMESRIKNIEASVEETDKTLAKRLEKRRAAIKQETEAVERDLELVRTQREELSAEVKTLSGTLEEIKVGHVATMTQIGDAEEKLAELRERQRVILEETASERNKMVFSIRSEAPVSAIIGDAREFMMALASKGVISIGGLAEMPQQDLLAAARDGGVQPNTARRFQREAKLKLEEIFN